MAIYDLGTASLAANGEVTGIGTTWKAPLTLIRVGATIVFKTEPVQIYTISEIISDTQINVYNPNSETVPAGTGYAILAHDGITVQGLAQDVAETLRYYQSSETEVADAVDAFNNFDSADFESKVTQVNTQYGDVVTIAEQVNTKYGDIVTIAEQVSSDASSSQINATNASSSADRAEAAANSVSGTLTLSFSDGGTVESKRQQVLYINGNEVKSYVWTGSLPKTFPVGSTPETSGGVGLGAWVIVGDASLRSDLAKTNGAGLIGGLSKPITFWGAVGDGVTNNTSAFNSAEDSQFNDIYIPEGNFKVDNITFNKRYWGPGIVVIDHKSDFTGVGINDMTVSGIYNGQQDLNAIVRIKEASNPDKLEFSTDNGVTWHGTIDVYNPIDDSVSPQPIVILAGGVDFFVSGLKINFSSTTGHTANDSWSFLIPSNPSVINTGSGSIVKSGSVIFNVSGNNDTNTSAGKDSLGGGNVGANNTAYGWKCLYSNTTGYANTASGIQSMENNKTGKNNCAYGADSLRTNVSGSDNVAVGVFASGANTTGYGNTGLGNDANRYNETGFGNTAAGVQALYHNKAGNENTAFGEYALRGGSSSLPTGTSVQYSVAVGAKSCFNASGNNNTAIGYEALYAASGANNVGVGFDAGFKVTRGSFNIFLGALSGNVTGQAEYVDNCVLLGDNTKSTGSNAVAIGSGVTAAQNTIAIGNSYHTDIFQYGNLNPQLDNTFSIGSSSARYTQVYATNGTINTSDERLKTPLDFDLLDAEKRAAAEIKKHIGKFRWLDHVGSKVHFGVGAQAVERILTKNGLNSNDYAFLVKENGSYGINYGELAMFILMAI